MIRWTRDPSCGSWSASFPATLSSPDGLMSEVAVVAGMGEMCGPSNVGLCSRRLRARPAGSRDRTGPLMRHRPPVTRQLPGGTVSALDHFPHGRAAVTALDACSGYRFAFPPSPRRCPWTYRVPLSCHGFPCGIASAQGSPFTAHEVPRWPGPWTPLVSPCSPPSWAADLTEQWNGLSEAWSQSRLSPAELGLGSPGRPVCPESAPPCGAVYSTVRIRGSRNQGVEMAVAPLTVTPGDPSAKFFFLFLWPYALQPRGLSSRERDASSRRHSSDPTELKLRLTGHFGLLRPLSQQAKKGVTGLAEWLVLTTGLDSCAAVEEWKPVGSHSRATQAGLFTSQTLQERRFGPPHQVENHDRLRCLLKTKEYGWAVREDSYKCQLQPCDQSQDKGCNCHERFLLTIVCLSFLPFLISLSCSLRCGDLIS